MKYPEYAKIRDKKYKINTDFRVAIECDNIARNENIGDYERSLAIIYKLFGDEGLNDSHNHEKLLELAQKYLSRGEELVDNGNDKQDMDLTEDEGFIKSSFKYDYQYDPYQLEYMHWYEFLNDLSNLSNSEFGDCCVLNRVIKLRNTDLKEIKDPKERQKIQETQELVSLKRNKKEKRFTKEEQDSIDKFNKLAGID